MRMLDQFRQIYDYPDHNRIAAMERVIEHYPSLVDFAGFIFDHLPISSQDMLDVASRSNRSGKYQQSIVAILNQIIAPEMALGMSPAEITQSIRSGDLDIAYLIILTRYIQECQSNGQPLPPELLINSDQSGTHLQTINEVVSLVLQ